MTTEQQLESFRLHVRVWLMPKLRFAGLRWLEGHDLTAPRHRILHMLTGEI